MTAVSRPLRACHNADSLWPRPSMCSKGDYRPTAVTRSKGTNISGAVIHARAEEDNRSVVGCSLRSAEKCRTPSRLDRGPAPKRRFALPRGLSSIISGEQSASRTPHTAGCVQQADAERLAHAYQRRSRDRPPQASERFGCRMVATPTLTRGGDE